jgi:tetratricopeptide (TPR) repeat protein
VKRFLTVGTVLLALAGSSGAFTQQTSTATGASKATQPAGKHVPQAKTHPEFNDYNAAYALSGGAVLEKAADEFAARYADSELKVFLYSKAMHDYQQENNPAKMLSVGNKVLQLDPDNTIALVLTATVLADGLSDQDANRQEKAERVKKTASHALETMDSAFTPPANASPEQVNAFKSTLQSMAHSALGIVALKMNDDAKAENELKMASDLNKTQPDPYIWYHLALAQDHQKKYDEALVSVKQAIQNAASSPDLGELAKSEEKRLITLTGGTAPTPKPK